jgi:molybdenum cofactor cytidylyltransferase
MARNLRPCQAPSGHAAANPGVAAVVLAAGGSTRMAPIHKLLIEIDGEPMVRRVARSALEAGLAATVAVVGHEAAAVRAALAGLPLAFAENPSWREGIASSIRVGLASVPENCTGALILLADMPRVRPAHLQRLCAAFARHGAHGICVPSFGGQRGNPVLWGRAHFPALAALTGDRGGRVLFEALRRHLVEVPMDDDAVLYDVDTAQALSAVCACPKPGLSKNRA